MSPSPLLPHAYLARRDQAATTVAEKTKARPLLASPPAQTAPKEATRKGERGGGSGGGGGGGEKTGKKKGGKGGGGGGSLHEKRVCDVWREACLSDAPYL